MVQRDTSTVDRPEITFLVINRKGELEKFLMKSSSECHIRKMQNGRPEITYILYR